MSRYRADVLHVADDLSAVVDSKNRAFAAFRDAGQRLYPAVRPDERPSSFNLVIVCGEVVADADDLAAVVYCGGLAPAGAGQHTEFA